MKKKKPPPKHPKDIPFAARLLDANSNPSLLVDGSTTAVDYTFAPDDDVNVAELTLVFQGTGQITYNQFLELTALANGVAIEIQTSGELVNAAFTTTRELLEYSSPDGFYVDKDANSYIVKATRQFSQGLRLRDRFGDFVKLTVADDLSRLTYGVASVLGYTD
jgi:hypothetical protein